MERKQFRVYQRPNKYLDNHLELQRMIKRNIKTLKGIEYEDLPTDDLFSNTRNTPRPASFAKFIKKNKSLSSFKALINDKDSKKCLHIFPALKNLHSLSKLDFEDMNSHILTPEISHAFTHCAKNLKHLTNLDFRLDESDINPVKSLQTLHFIASLHCLSHLSLDLPFAEWITDESLLTLSYHLPFLTSLKSLSLDLTFINGVTKISLSNLFSSFSRLSLLSSLSLKAGGCEVLDFSTTIALFENLKDLQNFQDLHLQLGYKNYLKSDDQDPLAIGFALLNPSSFQKLSLGFYQDYSDSDLSAFLIVLQRFSSLTNLSLTFSPHDYITSKGLASLPVTLSRFPALKALNLLINSLIDTESFFEMVSLCLKERKELVSLKLDTWSSLTIDNFGLQQLCSQLPSLPKLQNLDLSLGSNSRLDARTIENLSQALQNMTDLKSLDLFCSADNKSRADIFDGLIRSVGCLTHLKRLNLSLEGKFNLKEEIVENVTTSLKSLNCLAELYLSFEMRNKKDRNLEQFKNLLRALDSHERLLDIRVHVPYFWDNQSWEEFQRGVENKVKKFHIYINY